MTKKSQGWGSLLAKLLVLVPSIFNIASHFLACLEDELRQAKRSLILLFVLALVALSLLISGWVCLCAILFLCLQAYFSNIATLAVLFAGHLILLLIIGMWMALVKNGLFFNKTRELFHRD